MFKVKPPSHMMVIHQHLQYRPCLSDFFMDPMHATLSSFNPL